MEDMEVYTGFFLTKDHSRIQCLCGPRAYTGNHNSLSEVHVIPAHLPHVWLYGILATYSSFTCTRSYRHSTLHSPIGITLVTSDFLVLLCNRRITHEFRHIDMVNLEWIGYVTSDLRCPALGSSTAGRLIRPVSVAYRVINTISKNAFNRRRRGRVVMALCSGRHTL